MTDVEQQRIIANYESPQLRAASLMLGGHLHFGYWDSDSAGADLAAAADRLSQLMIERTDVGSNQKLIDIGCGEGQPALKLATAKGCAIDGVTISGQQRKTAATSAQRVGLDDRVCFFQCSALELPFPDRTYDAAWFFESIFHMGHRAALREASRVLKPGAMLLLTDLPVLPNTTEKFMAFAHEYVLGTFVDKADYPRLLEEAGFELLAVDDITDNVMPWMTPKSRQSMEAHKPAIREMVGDNIEQLFDNWLFAMEYMSEQLGYVLVTARKL
jgi:ubiquinone/menaquinone biosynthesis C-methylase UbiE